VAQIAASLTTFCAAPLAHRTPAGADAAADLPAILRAAVGERTGRDALRDALRADPALLGRLLADLGRVLPFTPVLVIDQAEEVFTLARTPDDEANRALALEMLRRAATGPGGFKVVVSLRTEYHGRLTDKLRKGANPTAGVRDYLLTDFGHEALTEVIRRPTSAEAVEHAAEVPAEKYGFRFAAGVAEDIARRTRAYSINRSDSVLPLVQVVCAQLYDRVCARADEVITAADLEAIGGVEGGMRAHAEAIVKHLFPNGADQRAFKRLLADPRTQLFIRQADGTLTTALLPASFLAHYWRGRMPFEDVLRTAGDGDRRLVRVNSLRIGGDQEEQRYVSLGHDALAKVAARWQEEQRRRAQVRKFAAGAAVAVSVAVGAFAFQAEASRLKLQQAENEAQLAQTKLDEAERRAKVRGQFAGLFAKADQAATAAGTDGIPWENVAAVLSNALEVAKADPDAFADWPLKQSADKLLAKAQAALADKDRRAAEREKLKRLGRHHHDAVFYSTQAAGLGEQATHDLVRAAVKAGLNEVGVELDGRGPPQLTEGFFTPDEARRVAHRCYELLLIDAHATALAPVADKESVGDRRKKVRDALRMLDRADRLLPAGTRTRVGLARRAEYHASLNEEEAARVAREAADATSPALAADYYLIGLEYYHREEYVRAISALGEALRAEPEHYGATFLLGVSYLRDRRPQDATLVMDRCLALRPEFVWPLVYRAAAEAELARDGKGRYEKAEADLAEAMKQGKGDDAIQYAARTTLGVIEYRRTNWDDAIKNLSAAVALRKDALPARVSLALAYRDRAEAVPVPVAAWALAPGGPVGYAAAVAEHRRAGLADARRVLDEAITLQPRVALLYHERVRVHVLRGDADAAREDVAKAILLARNLKRNSTLADDLLELGRLKHQARDFPAAADAFRFVHDFAAPPFAAEKRALAAHRLADALLALRDFDGAAKAADNYLALTPAPEGTTLPAGQAGRLAAALKLRGVIHADPRNADRNLRAAIDYYTRSLVFARDPQVLTLRASAYAAAGATGLAVADFDEALKARPGDADALLGRAELRALAGQYREALADADEADRAAAAPGALPHERKRHRYTAARVYAQVVVADLNTDTAPARVGRVAALLRATFADVAPADRAKFWQDAVLADPALARLAAHPALAELAAGLGVAGRAPAPAPSAGTP
jgi:tetratricopeptide (TPR) repeat protein